MAGRLLHVACAGLNASILETLWMWSIYLLIFLINIGNLLNLISRGVYNYEPQMQCTRSQFVDPYKFEQTQYMALDVLSAADSSLNLM